MSQYLKLIFLLLSASLLMAAKPNLGGFRPPQVCQAAIASLLGIKVSQVQEYRSGQSLMQFRVAKAGQTDSYYCQLQADNVLWRRSQDSQWQQSPHLRYQYNASARQLLIKHYLVEAQLAEFGFRGEDF